MSRTTRRKNYVPGWITKKYVRQEGTWNWAWVPLEGKELQKALVKYHSCKHGYWRFPTKFTRQAEQVSYRMKARTELERFKKNPDYEVQIPRKNLLPWD